MWTRLKPGSWAQSYFPQSPSFTCEVKSDYFASCSGDPRRPEASYMKEWDHSLSLGGTVGTVGVGVEVRAVSELDWGATCLPFSFPHHPFLRLCLHPVKSGTFFLTLTPLHGSIPAMLTPKALTLTVVRGSMWHMLWAASLDFWKWGPAYVGLPRMPATLEGTSRRHEWTWQLSVLTEGWR